MIKTEKYIEFGFLDGNPCRETPTDTLEDMKNWRNSVGIDAIIRHIESLEAGYMCGMTESIDAVTGVAYPAAQFDDGPFFFPIDVLRYLKRGDIHGVPKEYEEYIVNQHKLT